MNFFLIMIPVLVNVAFVTLMERKILGYCQYRKGPNKVSFVGLLQPFSDALKLLTKETVFLWSSNYKMYLFMPALSLFTSMMLWVSFPFFYQLQNLSVSWVFLMMIMSVGVYPLLLSGWSSNSHYSYLGSIRATAQTISYEVSISLIIFIVMLTSLSLTLESTNKFVGEFNVFMMFPFVLLLWFMSCLAETNRSPFDFSEGESELVSGFNTEYGGAGFAMIFMAEYMNILFLSGITSSFLFCPKSLMFFIFLTFVSFFWIWARATYPRHRYDFLMMLSWKSIMPFLLFLIMVLLVILPL